MKGYKICASPTDSTGGNRKSVLVELDIPDDAEWITPPYIIDFGIWGILNSDWANTNSNKDPAKSRASKAKVTKIYGGFEEVFSYFRPSFVYREGQEVSPEEPFDHSDFACSRGIHFFVNKKDALTYAARFYGAVEHTE